MLHLNRCFTPGRSQKNVQELSLDLLKSQGVEIKSSKLQVRGNISLHDVLALDMLDLYRTPEMKKSTKSPTFLPCQGGHQGSWSS